MISSRATNWEKVIINMVLVSLSRRFYYVAIPKTASTLVRSLLRSYCDKALMSQHSHESEAGIQRLVQAHGHDFARLVGLATVRNPWARLYSAHNYRLRVGASPPPRGSAANRWYQGCVEYAKASTPFLVRLHEGTVARPKPQVSFLLPGETSSVIVMRQENLLEDLRKAWSVINLDPGDLEELPHANVSTRDDYREQYDDAGRRKVEEWYSDDIQRFGYNFLN